MSANIPSKDSCDSTTLKSQAFLKQISSILKLTSEAVLFPIFNILSLNELEIAAWSIILEKFGIDQRFTMEENLQITAFAAKLMSCYDVQYYQDLLERSIHDFVNKYQKWSAKKGNDLSISLKEVNARFRQMNDQCNSVNPLVDPWNGDFNAMVDFLDSDESTCQGGAPVTYASNPTAVMRTNGGIVGSKMPQNAHMANGNQWDFIDDGLKKQQQRPVAAVRRNQPNDSLDFLFDQDQPMYFDTGVVNADALAPAGDDIFDDIDRF